AAPAVEETKKSVLNASVAPEEFDWDAWMLYFAAEYNISSQKGGKPNAAVCFVLEVFGIIKSKSVFLQHGITINRAVWLFYENTKIKKFICGAKPEYDYIKEHFGYPEDNLCYLGFPRFDDYHGIEPDKNRIVLMPSWREWIASKNEYSNEFEDTSDFTSTEYFKRYQELINSEALDKLLSEKGITMYFYPHRNMQKYIESFKTASKNIKIVDNKTSDIRELLMKSAAMITDYSSVALDFAYMKKPVIYYQFDEERFRLAQYAEGYYSYRDSGLGVVTNKEKETVEELREIINRDFTLSEKGILAHSDFFPVWDDKNCERIYNELIGK
ncbi:MAG: CDP-glycerol glycerophosphotransferase family protein, partial [Clostridia bacterium]|nr:CDP-glycerol glycerophosphotransferase family protein [Clostridia bacterium]